MAEATKAKINAVVSCMLCEVVVGSLRFVFELG